MCARAGLLQGHAEPTSQNSTEARPPQARDMHAVSAPSAPGGWAAAARTCGPQHEVAVLGLALAVGVERELLADVGARRHGAALGHALHLGGARHDARLQQRLLCGFHQRRRLALHTPTATHVQPVWYSVMHSRPRMARTDVFSLGICFLY